MVARKVELIFQNFDKDSVGRLDKAKVANFIRTVNPGVPLTGLQVEAIVDEVFEEYALFVNDSGLSLEGLERIYGDGVGNVDVDFATLGLKLESPRLDLSTKPSLSDAVSISPRRNSESLPLPPSQEPVLPELTSHELPRQASGAESLPEIVPEPQKQEAPKAILVESVAVREPPAPKMEEEPPKPVAARNPPRLRVETDEESLNPRVSIRGSRVAGIKQRLEARGSPRDASPGPRGPGFGAQPGSPARPPSPLRRPASPAGARVAAMVSSLEASSPIAPGRVPSPQRSARPSMRGSFGAMDWAPPQLSGVRERPPPSGPPRGAELPAALRRSAPERQATLPEASVNPKPAAVGHQGKGTSFGFHGSKHDLLKHRTTDSRGSDFGSIIMARSHGSQAGSEDFGRDEGFESGYEGEDSLQRMPSAVSIEARSAGSFGDWMNQHSRVPSAAEEILEAANMPQLHVMVPPAVNRAASSHLMAPSPSNSAKAEIEAQVGHESLDSGTVGADPELSATVVEVNPEVLQSDVDAAAIGDLPRQQASELRTKVQLVTDPAAAFKLHMSMGRLLADRGRHEEAVLSFQPAVQGGQADARAYFRLGNSLFALERYSEAELAFKQALKVASSVGQRRLLLKVRTNLGISLEAQGLLLGACERYREVVAADSSHHRAWKLLGGALYGLGDLSGAENALRAALKLDGRNADAHCDMGCTLCALGDAGAARQEFNAALDLDDGHIEAWFNLGNLERQCMRYEDALQCYKQVLGASPGHWRALLNSCIALVGLRRPKEAQAALAQALEISGQGEAVKEEVRQLRRLAERGATAAELAGVASAVSHKTASAAPSPLRPTPERQLRGQRGDAPTAGLDLALLKSLAPLTVVSTQRLLLTARQLAQTEVMSAADVEVLLRELLPELPAKRFANLTKATSASLLHSLAPNGKPGIVQPRRLLAALSALSDESWYSRGKAMFAVLAAGQGYVMEAEADALLVALQDALCMDQEGRAARLKGPRFAALHSPEELMATLTEAGRGFPVLPRLPSLAMGRDS